MSHMFDRTSGSLDFFAVLAKLRPQSFFLGQPRKLSLRQTKRIPGANIIKLFWIRKLGLYLQAAFV